MTKEDAIKKAPYQKKNYKSGTIEWDCHYRAWTNYARKYGISQSAERIAERGGFGEEELDKFFGENWRDYIL